MLTNRSAEIEILDLGPGHYTLAEFKHCQKMLFKVNKLLGVVKDITCTLKALPQNITVLDIGCGGGELLLYLSQHFPNVRWIGTDISADAIQTAQEALHNKKLNIEFQLQLTTQLVLAEDSMDAILVTMVCHHIPDEALVEFLATIKKAARQVVIIHDLQRHFLAEWFFKMLSPILFRSKIMTHDGLISIRKGFTRKEWRALLHAAGIVNYQIKWRFPFRWKILIYR